mmetsp:Transcript_34783/g.68217  ORF Transcript_34783/g.68217 Transcript_34783/m.68217 type:complete len:664 (+) Transcript_34783:60-2051(+)|eukprot:CAMPEP_0173381006 /NCGR_PEP_ID=MMETSP1356-20130122/3525_1 /TAXON_ID=77927 ORGANISM="Hemiselmis virescens, Strain PCC157" /NCGR_SAMPLE_ID=MMETSP1356 /ASSEMBLY_ACC=CAM_ASM_000847 /LENGTH=663 /DNA_ID=CAMNT_0014334737 /DNA_START=42 /DNA_END=2033 /DNA_ORIENTATION=+
MGLLDVAGAPLEWSEAKKHADHVRTHGIEQFISIYNNYKDKANSVLRWGDEVEYFVIKLDADKRETRLPLRSPEILKALADFRERLPRCNCAKEIIWHPEYANWMLEGTPGQPYCETPADLLEVESNMMMRRKCIQKFLQPGEAILTLPVYPRLGTPNFTHPPLKPSPAGEVSRSLYIPDECIQPHPRFPTLTANIRKRRGEKVLMPVPIYMDTHTQGTLDAQRREIESQPGAEDALRDLPNDAIYLDCMAFGMGAGCLQMTFQAKDLGEARFLYDQLAILAPLFLALTAASPVWKGMLADVDVRWDVISGSVDDRPRSERGLEELREGERRIYKSRYSSVDCFISRCDLMRDEFNDIPCPIDEAAKRRLEEAGLDDRLATHVAHLFIRDPLVVFEGKLNQSDKTDNDHFENIQSTNWNTVRFKPPPVDQDKINWRVEFRPMEINLTDFENAAFTVYLLLLTRAISSQDLNFYMPMSKVDDNMHRAHRRGAALDEKFWIRRNVCAVCEGKVGGAEAVPDMAELSLDEIINGDGGNTLFGLNHCIRRHLNDIGCQGPTRDRLETYLQFVGMRASGKLMTTAAWMRKQVLEHPDYKGDSVVSEAICYDLMKRCIEVSNGTALAPELLGAFVNAEEPARERRDSSLVDKDGTGYSIYNNDNCDHCY